MTLFCTKAKFANDLGVKPWTIANWIARHLTRGYHYTVIGRTTIINVRRTRAWIHSHFDVLEPVDGSPRYRLKARK